MLKCCRDNVGDVGLEFVNHFILFMIVCTLSGKSQLVTKKLMLFCLRITDIPM